MTGFSAWFTIESWPDGADGLKEFSADDVRLLTQKLSFRQLEFELSRIYVAGNGKEDPLDDVMSAAKALSDNRRDITLEYRSEYADENDIYFIGPNAERKEFLFISADVNAALNRISELHASASLFTSKEFENFKLAKEAIQAVRGRLLNPNESPAEVADQSDQQSKLQEAVDLLTQANDRLSHELSQAHMALRYVLGGMRRTMAFGNPDNYEKPAIMVLIEGLLEGHDADQIIPAEIAKLEAEGRQLALENNKLKAEIEALRQTSAASMSDRILEEMKKNATPQSDQDEP